MRKQQVAAEVGREIAHGELDLGEKLLAKFEADGASVGSIDGQINDQIAASRERVEAATECVRREVKPVTLASRSLTNSGRMISASIWH